MANFFSTFECKLDAKGRLVLPAKFKAALPEADGNELVLRKGDDGCLEVHTAFEFQKTLNKVSAMSNYDPKHKAFKRDFLGNLTEVELDSAGRLLIPKFLQEHAGIDKVAIVIGVGKSMEIWNPERHAAAQQQLSPEDFESLATQFLD